MLVFTYNGHYVRAYIDGVLDRQELNPVKDKRTDRILNARGPAERERRGRDNFSPKPTATDENFSYNPLQHTGSKITGNDFTISAQRAVGSMLRESTK